MRSQLLCEWKLTQIELSQTSNLLLISIPVLMVSWKLHCMYNGINSIYSRIHHITSVFLWSVLKLRKVRPKFGENAAISNATFENPNALFTQHLRRFHWDYISTFSRGKIGCYSCTRLEHPQSLSSSNMKDVLIFTGVQWKKVSFEGFFKNQLSLYKYYSSFCKPII